ncbi:pyridoxal 5'-phosphate synthase glutaminase subunit PdxT [Arthrobacter pigmenti]
MLIGLQSMLMVITARPRHLQHAPYDDWVTNPTSAVDARGLQVGVLALQGDNREHLRVLTGMGAEAVPVRRPSELSTLDGLIIPGGESTTIDRLSRIFDLAEPLKERIAAGMPVYGSCAGMILLANDIVDAARNSVGEPQQTFGGLDITVRRNAFGRQRESFEVDLEFAQLQSSNGPPSPVRAVFIRAPWAERAGEGVQVLATVDVPGPATAAGDGGTARIVAVRSSTLLATSFHPEVTGERRVHELFIRMIRGET